MPAGCEFVCINKSCDYYRTGFVITSVWPLGDIVRVKDAPNVSRVPDLVENLIGEIKAGHPYACINFPNLDLIPYEGYRVTMWCPDCNCVWKYDVEIPEIEGNENPDRGEIIEQAIKDGVVDTHCSRCNTSLQNFEEVTKNGILCPHCHEKLSQQRWYSNELNMRE